MGQELDKLKAELNKKVGKMSCSTSRKSSARTFPHSLVAENVVLQLERRIAFRRAMKRAVQTTMAMGAEGIRIQCGGRLGGADIARTEQQRMGKVPLQTLRANISYGFSEASTVYGIIGVKCWICLPDEENA